MSIALLAVGFSFLTVALALGIVIAIVQYRARVEARRRRRELYRAINERRARTVITEAIGGLSCFDHREAA